MVSLQVELSSNRYEIPDSFLDQYAKEAGFCMLDWIGDMPTHIHTHTHTYFYKYTSSRSQCVVIPFGCHRQTFVVRKKLKLDEGRMSFHLDRGFVVGDRGPKQTFLRSFVRFLKNFQLFNQRSFSIFAWIRSRLRFSWSEITASSKRVDSLSAWSTTSARGRYGKLIDLRHQASHLPQVKQTNNLSNFHCIPLRLVTILRAERPIEPINPRLNNNKQNRRRNEANQIRVN